MNKKEIKTIKINNNKQKNKFKKQTIKDYK